jgi:hypothetical protein
MNYLTLSFFLDSIEEISKYTFLPLEYRGKINIAANRTYMFLFMVQLRIYFGP